MPQKTFKEVNCWHDMRKNREFVNFLFSHNIKEDKIKLINYDGRCDLNQNKFANLVLTTLSLTSVGGRR